jgi:hypothetical protein
MDAESCILEKRIDSMFRTLLVTLLMATASLSQTPSSLTSGTGSVKGVVIDADGKPVAEAIVFISKVSTQEGIVPMGGRIPLEAVTAKTNTEGSFTFSNFPVAYNVSLDAYQESAGYPGKLGSFYGYLRTKTSPSTFDVATGQKVQGIVIQFTARAAYLRFDISDENGKPLNASGDFLLPGPELSRPNRPFNMSTGINAKETMPVPSVPFWLNVNAPGYEPWHYGGERWQEKEGLITLRPGETLTLPIQLKKLP